MTAPTRKTRRTIAYCTMAQIAYLTVWVSLPGDIGVNEAGLMVVFFPSLAAILIGFMTNETYSDHSQRKHT